MTGRVARQPEVRYGSTDNSTVHPLRRVGVSGHARPAASGANDL